MYPGASDSLNWGTGCLIPNGEVNWSARTANIQPYDIRGSGSMGPFTFHPGEMQEIDVALLYARDYSNHDTLNPSVDKLRQMIDIVRNSYHTGLLPNRGSFFGINEQLHQSNPSIKIYPNPANDIVNVTFDHVLNQMVKTKIINTSEITVFSSLIEPGSKTVRIKTGEFPSGFYIVKVQGKDCNANAKLSIIH